MAKILVVDDEAIVRFTLKKVLQSAGHEVVEASTGLEGVASYKQSPCDLVITDLIMPDQDGVSTIKELKRDFPNVRIIASSGGGRTGNLDYLKLADLYGADATLSKPFSAADLLKTVQNVLDGRQN
jgi:CheY-like chemotaxis protein